MHFIQIDSLKRANTCNEVTDESISENSKKQCTSTTNDADLKTENMDTTNSESNQPNKLVTARNSDPIVKLSGILSESCENYQDNGDGEQEQDENLFKIHVEVFYCKLCCIVLNEEKNVKHHVTTNVHKSKLVASVSHGFSK